MKYITAQSVEKLLNALYTEERRLTREGYTAERAVYKRVRRELARTVIRAGAEYRTLWIVSLQKNWQKAAERQAFVPQTQLKKAAWQRVLPLVQETLKTSDIPDNSYLIDFRTNNYQVFDIQKRAWIVFPPEKKDGSNDV